MSPVHCIAEEYSSELLIKPIDLEGSLIVNDQYRARLLTFRHAGVRQFSKQPYFVVRYAVTIPGAGKNNADVSLELHDIISAAVQNYNYAGRGRVNNPAQLGQPCIVRRLEVHLADGTTNIPNIPLSVFYPKLSVRVDIASPFAYEAHFPEWDNATQANVVRNPLPADHATTDYGRRHDYWMVDPEEVWSGTLYTANEGPDYASGTSKRQSWCESDARFVPGGATRIASCDFNPGLISWWCPFTQRANSTPVVDDIVKNRPR
jgi:hypothetical protein